MAPCITSYPSVHQSRFPEKDNIRLRKPMVEKIRRDRINSCIEQLKVILEKELHQQEPNTKLEKADILEMTVSFLRRQLLQTPAGLSQRDHSQGFSQCQRESVQDFFSVGSSREPSVSLSPAAPRVLQQGELLLQTQEDRSCCSLTASTTVLQPSSSSSKAPVWRPW